jgi:4a-hydroxytetrahydrobiopterin dehydratase
MLLSGSALDSVLASLPNWHISHHKLHKTFESLGFMTGIAFVNALAQLAERQGHHPDMDIRYKHVHVSYTTHDAGGITQKDILAAKEADLIWLQLQQFSKI